MSSTAAQRPATVSDEQNVPFLKFPTHAETHRQGMQPLPTTKDVPQINPSSVLPYCMSEDTASSVEFKSWTELSNEEVLELVRMVGLGFAAFEPMCRYFKAQLMTDELRDAEYEDALGRHSWGHHTLAEQKEMTKEDLPLTMADALTWWIRMAFISDPEVEGRPLQQETLKRSTVAIDTNTGDFLGALIGVPATLPPSPDAPHPSPPADCVFHREINKALAPIEQLIGNMEGTAVPSLTTTYPAMKQAFEQHKVTCAFMISKSSKIEVSRSLPVDLFRAHFEQQIALGHEYFVTEASNPWTGAVMEAMGATPTYFAPHRSIGGIVKSDVPVKEGPSSPNGYVSDKDSGIMYYAGRF